MPTMGESVRGSCSSDIVALFDRLISPGKIRAKEPLYRSLQLGREGVETELEAV